MTLYKRRKRLLIERATMLALMGLFWLMKSSEKGIRESAA